MIVVIFLFLGNLRSTLIPIVTIPLSLIGVMFALLALGYSINLLTLLALVLAIGLVVDDAIVVVENIHRHIEEGMQPLRRGACRRARDRRAGHLHDHHAGRGLCADRLRLRPDRRAVPRVRLHAGRRRDRLGHHRADAVADDVLQAAQARDSGGGRLRAVSRSHASSACGSATSAGSHRTLELPPGHAADPRRRHGRHRHHVCHGAEGAGARGGPGHPLQSSSRRRRPTNLDYLEQATGQLYKVFETVPEKEHVFTINGMGGDVHQAFAGILFKPWEERKRTQTADPAEPAAARWPASPARRSITFGRPSLPGSTRRPAGAVRHHHDGRLPAARAGAGRRCRREAQKSGLFIFTDGDLKFETPQIELKIDHDKANRLGITMQDIGGSLATLLGGNYVNRFNLYGRSYQVIPQVPRDFRLTPDWLKRYQVRTSAGSAGAAVERRHASSSRCSPMR